MKRIVALVTAVTLMVTLFPGGGASAQPEVASERQSTLDLAAYFFVDEAGHANRTGPFLLPVNRRVPFTLATSRAAITALLRGPRPGELAAHPPISTQVPAGTELLGINISGGTATIDLSADFGADAPSAAAAQQVAQVVFTLTQFPTVQRVAFRQDGEPISVQTGSGQVVSRPVQRRDYRQAFEASISVHQPHWGGPGGNPMRVRGAAAVFEATFQYRLLDAAGNVLDADIAMSAGGNGFAPFDFTIDYEVESRQRGRLVVFARSAKDGSIIDLRRYPVVLEP